MKTNLSWLALLVATAAIPCFAQIPPPASGAPTPPDLEPGPRTPWVNSPGANGNLYQAFAAPKGITWQDAETFAESRGGHLATIHSAEENIFVFNLVNDPKYWVAAPQPSYIWGPWLGGMKLPTSTAPDQGWEWVNDEGRFTYTAWRGDQPDNDAGLENRLNYLASSLTDLRPDWNDERPNASIHGFIMEYGRGSTPPPVLPASPGLAVVPLNQLFSLPLVQGQPSAPSQIVPPPRALTLKSPSASPPPPPAPFSPGSALAQIAPPGPPTPLPALPGPPPPRGPAGGPPRPPSAPGSIVTPPGPLLPALIVAVGALIALVLAGVFILFYDRRCERKEMARRENRFPPR